MLLRPEQARQIKAESKEHAATTKRPTCFWIGPRGGTCTRVVRYYSTDMVIVLPWCWRHIPAADLEAAHG